MSEKCAADSERDEKSSDSVDLQAAAKTADSVPKYGFWQNLVHTRECLLKESSMDIPSCACSEKSRGSQQSRSSKKVIADDDDGDCISELIGHKGLWQLTWAFILIVFQVPSAFHIFSFVFQVSVAPTQGSRSSHYRFESPITTKLLAPNRYRWPDKEGSTEEMRTRSDPKSVDIESVILRSRNAGDAILRCLLDDA